MSTRLLTGTGLVAPPTISENSLNDNREVVRVLEFVQLDRQEGGGQETLITDDCEGRKVRGSLQEGSREEAGSREEGRRREDRRTAAGRGRRSRARRQEGPARRPGRAVREGRQERPDDQGGREGRHLH